MTKILNRRENMKKEKIPETKREDEKKNVTKTQ